MPIEISEFRIPSGREGCRLFLRNKRLPDAIGVPLLCVHGATYASTITFDYAIDGTSWMDWLARRGFDVWCIDLLGYGASDRPPEMALPPDANAPLVDTEEAVADVHRAIDHVLAQTGHARLDLLGYSWGTAICGQAAGDAPEQVRRLVLSGALWLLERAPKTLVPDGLGAFRLVAAEATLERWTQGLSGEQIACIGPRTRREAWATAAVASDPDSAALDPPQLRAPAGVVKDALTRWLQGVAPYDPGRICAPTLVVVGEWDQETTPAQGRAVFDRLSAAASRRYTLIGRGTHSLLLEDQRGDLYRVVADFLREGDRSDPAFMP
ncbi:MAG: alpha/beta fold hydrolase [Pseudomonadales bacterium]|jgi:pimeloyl-ACP methyl ester carboxylesterase|nr:alpha/beta fold hydrolase [Pseudomonadales bacterium]